MDPTPTSQDTPIISRNPGDIKRDNGNLTDLTFPISQNSPIFDLNGSKDDNRNLNVLTAPTSQDMPVNRDSNNDNNNNNGENLTDIRTGFEASRTFLIDELYYLRQQAKKLNIEEVNSGKERYNDFLPNHLQSEINYLREGNENKNSVIKVFFNNIDVFFLSETKLDETFLINQFQTEGYKNFRLDRNCYLGGVSMYVNQV